MANKRPPASFRRDLTIQGVCRKHRIGRSTYNDMQKRGAGPDIIHIGRSVRITPEADDEWVQRMGAQAPGGVPKFAPKRQARGKEKDGASTAPKERRHSKKHRTRSGNRPHHERRRGTGSMDLNLTELKSLLRTNKRLPKDAFLESSRWRLPTNPHRHRDRGWERAFLKALTGAGSSENEQQQAVEQANCTPEARCRHPMCWFCKHRAWRKFRRKLAGVLDHEVPRDDISWVTIVVGVCEPSPQILDSRKVEFHSFLKEAARKSKLMLFGRFEVDLVRPRDLNGTTFKRKTLLQLGLPAKGWKLVAVLHVHLIAYHPKIKRGVVSLRLKQTFRGPRRTEIDPLWIPNQMQTKALDNLTRYMLKSRPPEFALLQEGRSVQPRKPKVLRVYNGIVNALAGEKGECVVGNNISRRASNIYYLISNI